MNRLHRSDLHRILILPLGKKIDTHTIEKWSASLWDRPRQKPLDREPFVMMFPPPNITGNLHLGHALTAAFQDALIRQKQMQGRRSIWIPGFDHAGLGTQSIVEKQLWHKSGITRQQLGREKFNELVNEWKDLKLTEMKNQLDRLGLTLDSDKEYFTMDENSSLAVQSAFKQLFNAGLIYRSVKPVFWSRQLNTTLSDIEVERVDGEDRYVRTGETVERRALPQWFVKAKDMAIRSVEVIDNSSINMIPPNYKRSWSSWLLDNGVEDWCISRQSWWGHRIPAYRLESSTDVQESWIVADSLEEAGDRLGNSKAVLQDPDVLDTWFSSSLLPLTVSGWPNQEKFSENCRLGLFPLDIMETGFDILNYWVSKMVMMSLALENKIPFKLILLHGMICDSKGKKMSKSKGNVIDPLDVIDGITLQEMHQQTNTMRDQGIIEGKGVNNVLENQKNLFPNGIPSCGADGLRAYLLSHDIQEEVVRIQIVQIEKVRRLSNKIWNIFRFTLPLIERSELNKGQCFDTSSINLEQLDLTKLDNFDQQVLDELAKCVHIAESSFDRTYQLHASFNSLEQFWTNKLSIDYIGGVKAILLGQSGDEEERQLKLQILVGSILTATKLLHPFMPHLTEFLYHKLCTTTKAVNSDKINIEKICPLSLQSFPRPEDWTRYLTSTQVK